jgi:hypothetical protein
MKKLLAEEELMEMTAKAHCLIIILANKESGEI